MNDKIKELIELESQIGSNYVEQSCGYFNEKAIEAGLTEEQFLTLRMMVSNGEDLIQHHLFSNTGPSKLEQKLCEYLDQALCKLPIEDTTPIVYRYDNSTVINAAQKGTVINFPGYLTTSKCPYIGIDGKFRYIVHLAGRTKARCIYRVCEITRLTPEYQVEFPRGTQFLVYDYRVEGDYTIIELIEQPDDILPVERLSDNVSDFFDFIKSIDIQDAINKGLNPLIRQAVSIDGKKINALCSDEGFVYFSPTYAQALWNLAYVGVVISDTRICNDMLRSICHTNLQSVCEEIDKAKCNDYRAQYFKALNESISIDEMLYLAHAYLQNINQTSDNRMLSSLPVDGVLESRINGVYRAGMGCVLLHELTHYYNDHFDRSKFEDRRDLELEADKVAFEGILSIENPKERNTAIIGGICSQLLGFYMNPYMVPSENYYGSDIRLFAIYDMVEGDKRSVGIVIANVLQSWLERFHHIPVTIQLDNELEAVEEIREIVKNIRIAKTGL